MNVNIHLADVECPSGHRWRVQRPDGSGFRPLHCSECSEPYVRVFPVVRSSGRAVFVFVEAKSNLVVDWKSHPRTCLYHATVTGRLTALCGAGGLADENAYPSCYNQSNDLMTCKRCQGLVRRVPTAGEEMVHV